MCIFHEGEYIYFSQIVSDRVITIMNVPHSSSSIDRKYLCKTIKYLVVMKISED